ncbi:MAG TPA: uridylate kinase, partial [Clostridia bacterium]|nr:uridylate kinase [Clostridia bacterium]
MSIELVGKIGSMALIRQEDNDINYNILARLGDELHPGMIWVSSGATEIGRVDYLRRHGRALSNEDSEAKTDYAAQGQAILMASYRQFVRPEYSIRQVLVEHQHFNDAEKREHIRRLLLRAADQGAIPIVNYNDP